MKIVNGYLCDDNGQRIKDAAGNEIQVQELFDGMLNSRLGKERTAKEGLESRVQELQDQLAKAVKPEDKAALEARIDELQGQLETKEQTVARQFSRDMDKLKDQLKAEQDKNKALDTRWKDSQFSAMTAAAATEYGFKKPQYLEMMLRQNLNWEDELDTASGKPTGNQVPRFKFMVTPEGATAPVEKLMDIKEAAGHLAKLEPDLVLGSESMGSGGTGNPNNPGKPQASGLSSMYKPMS
jgi:deoxyribodipyrimidine photolyase-like uncharacterized protein